MKMRSVLVVLVGAMVAWMGVASAAETTITMDANKTVTAVFVKQWTLTIAATPSTDGTTTPASGTHTYDEGATINLSATANPGYAFDHWEGDVADPNAAETTITMDADKTVTAVFIQGWTLTVQSTPAPGVPITGTHPGVTTYSAPVSEGTPVTLTAPTFADGFTFEQWSDESGELLSPSQTLALSFLSDLPDSTSLYAGTAKVDITPPEEDAVDLTNNEMQILDNIYARVLVLKTDDVSLAIVSLDLILFSSAKVVADAKAQWGVDHVMLCSTHTHSSMAPQGLIIGGGQPDWTRMGDPEELIDWPGLSSDPWYAETESKIVAAIGTAMSNLFPARIGSAASPFEGYYTTHNRRHINADGSVSMWWSNLSRLPSPPVDHQIRAIRVDDASGNPRAVMVHYACHPVCLMNAGWLSPDFPGTMCDYIESELGEDCMGMFLQGAEGDIDPYEISLTGDYGFDYVEQAGIELGQAAVSLAESITTPETTAAAIRIEESMVPIEHRDDDGSTEACVMTVVINDELAMVTIPGEPFIQHQLNLAARSPIANTIMLGLAYCGQGNPFLIYVPTAQAVTEGGYGATECSFVEPDAGENMVNAALAVINAFTSDMTVVAEYIDSTIPDVLYVNDDVVGEAGSVCTVAGNDANDGLTPDTPMRNIQALLDAYPDIGTGRTVWVDPGTYVENVTIGATHSGLTLQGAGQDVTIIDGSQAGSCLALNGFANGVISGFTFSNGSATNGGGIYNAGSSLTVADCTFTGNWAELGAGLYNETGTSSTVTNCTFTDNSGYCGGGMLNYYATSSTVTDCTFSGNEAYQNPTWGGGGGGMLNHFSPTTMTNCVFDGNTADWGGAMYNEGTSITLTNCTLSGNAATGHGGAICSDNSTPTLTNCVLWGNTAPDGPQISSWDASGPNTITVGYSNVQGGQAGVFMDPTDTLNWGSGNIDADPLFVDAPGGDYHLQAGSPCIDSADGASAPALDMDGIPRNDDAGMPNVGIGPPWADMGAYEYPYSTTPDVFYVNDDSLAEAGSLCTAVGNDANDGFAPSTPMRGIQALLNKYPDIGTGKTVLVDPGTYVENIAIGATHSGLTLQGADAETTIIDGNLAGSCLGANGFNDGIVSGFTFQNGSAYSGAGMNINACNPIVTNCIFTNNSASELGGGMFNGTGSSPTVTNCTFSGNSARWGAGMLNYHCEAIVTDCIFDGNNADLTTSGGGGMVNHYSSITVTSCIFTNNTADSGGAICNEGTPTVMTNCTFIGNSAADDGGGICNDDASPTVTNCIFWGNTATRGAQIGYYAVGPTGANTLTVQYSDVQGGEAAVSVNTIDTLNWGSGNIDADPSFVSTTDLHLQAGSPCIDSGDGVSAPSLDMDGNPRHDDLGMPNVGNGPPWVDMGACEFQADTPTGMKGDFDLDGDVDFWDFMAFIDVYGLTDADPGWLPNGPIGDFDDDGDVDFWDFMEFIDVYGS